MRGGDARGSGGRHADRRRTRLAGRRGARRICLRRFGLEDSFFARAEPRGADRAPEERDERRDLRSYRGARNRHAFGGYGGELFGFVLHELRLEARARTVAFGKRRLSGGDAERRGPGGGGRLFGAFGDAARFRSRRGLPLVPNPEQRGFPSGVVAGDGSSPGL